MSLQTEVGPGARLGGGGPGGGGVTATGLVVAAGVIVLLTRPWLVPASRGVGAGVALFLALGLVGGAWPLSPRAEPVLPPRPAATTALVLGVVAFASAWALAGPRPPAGSVTAVTVLAHGGAAGAALEIGFILIPIVIFLILARVSKRRVERDEAEEEDGP